MPGLFNRSRWNVHKSAVHHLYAYLRTVQGSALNESNSNLPDTTGRPFGASFSAESASATPVSHHAGTLQGLHNMHDSNNIPGTLTLRNSTMNGVPSGAAQQPGRSLSNVRFSSNNIPVALSQISHGSSQSHSGVANRGGMGVSPILGNSGSRITSSMGNIVGGGSIGRNISSGGGLSVAGLASRLNLAGNNGSGNLSLQMLFLRLVLMGSVLPQETSDSSETDRSGLVSSTSDSSETELSGLLSSTSDSSETDWSGPVSSIERRALLLGENIEQQLKHVMEMKERRLHIKERRLEIRRTKT